MVSVKKFLLGIACTLALPLMGMKDYSPLLGQMDPGVPDEVYLNVILPAMIRNETSIEGAIKKLLSLRKINKRWYRLLTDNKDESYFPIGHILTLGLSQEVKDKSLQYALERYHNAFDSQHHLSVINIALDIGADVNQIFSMTFEHIDWYELPPVSMKNSLLCHVIYCLYKTPCDLSEISKAHQEQVLVLLDKLLDTPGINVNTIDDSLLLGFKNNNNKSGKRTPLAHMALAGMVSHVKKLIFKRADLEIPDAYNNTVICSLVVRIIRYKEENATHKKATQDIAPYLQILQLLIDAGAQVNVPLKECGVAPIPLLQYAMKKSDDELVEILLSGRGVDLSTDVVSGYENYEKYKDKLDAAREKPAKTWPERVVFVPNEPPKDYTIEAKPVVHVAPVDQVVLAVPIAPAGAVVPVLPATASIATTPVNLAPVMPPIFVAPSHNKPIAHDQVNTLTDTIARPAATEMDSFSKPLVFGISLGLAAVGCAYWYKVLRTQDDKDEQDNHYDDEGC